MIYFFDGGGAAGPTSSTWNPSDKEASVVLSNGNLTATKAGTGFQTVRGAAGKSSGVRYFEVTVDVASSTTISVLIGAADSSFTYGLGLFIGQHNNASAKKSIGYWSPGYIYDNLTNAGAETGGFPSYTVGAVVGVLLDFANFTVKYYDGLTGTLLHTDVDATPWGTFYPAITMRGGGKGTLNCLGPFTYLPSGAVEWDS